MELEDDFMEIQARKIHNAFTVENSEEVKAC